MLVDRLGCLEVSAGGRGTRQASQRGQDRLPRGLGFGR
jgi:hypothetical protein